MDHLRQIRDFEHIKLLSDNRRLTILRLLMAEPYTLTGLGQILDEHPARVRHHVKQLEQAGLIEVVETHVVRGFVEKFYRARARAFLLQQYVLPANTEKGTLIVQGSHALALELLASALREAPTIDLELFSLPIGSLEGLVALRQGLAHLAGSHLYDPQDDDFNVPYLRRLFPDREMSLVTLAHRQQGLLLQPGNPQGVHVLADLARPELTLINRNRGSGTRLWFDRQLAQQALPAEALHGYEREARTHTAVAEAIRAGQADAGIGLLAAARRYELDFIPLFEERFDLVLPSEQVANPRLQPLFNLLTDRTFRRQVEALGGYSTQHTGEQIKP